MILNSIIDKDEAEKTAVTFFPKKFPMRITEHAVSFHKMQSGEKRTDFRIDHSVSEQTGIGELERLSIEERVEQQALIKVKEMQEEAYNIIAALCDIFLKTLFLISSLAVLRAMRSLSFGTSLRSD